MKNKAEKNLKNESAKLFTEQSQYFVKLSFTVTVWLHKHDTLGLMQKPFIQTDLF